nr:MAG TPA: hypothetical protein [Caudoviricetes sp.]
MFYVFYISVTIVTYFASIRFRSQNPIHSSCIYY